MIPVSLKFQAFESYVHPAVVDFTKLDRLFLIHGETGAGKSAVLDAITYSLYGESSGGERANFRCADRQAEDIPTETEFVFSIKGKLYKFTRSIKIAPRSKKQEQKQDCFYLDENDTWIPFFENPKQLSVKQKAEELLGLTSEQFRQVIILPQGAFEKLLTSDSAEKEKILSTLFNADKYTRLSNQLYSLADSERKTLSEKKSVLDAVLKGENAANESELGQMLSDKNAELNEKSFLLEDIKKYLEELNENLAEQQLLADKFIRLDNTKNSIMELNEKKSDIDKLKELIARSEKAGKLSPIYKEFNSAFQNYSERKKIAALLLQETEQLRKSRISLIEEEKQLNENSKNNDLNKAELMRLDMLSEFYEQAEPTRLDYNQRKKELDVIKSKLDELTNILTQNTALIDDLKRSKIEIEEEYSDKPIKLKTRLDELDRGKASLDKIETYKTLLKKLESEQTQAERLIFDSQAEISKAENKYNDALSAYIKGVSSSLARELAEGSPCPVCGSIHHPSPAHENATTYEQDINVLRSELSALQKKHLELISKNESLKERIRNGKSMIEDEQKNIDNVLFSQEEYTAVKNAISLCNKKLEELKKLSVQISEQEDRTSQINVQINELKKNYDEANEKVLSSSAKLDLIIKKLDRNIPDLNALRVKIKELKASTEKYDEDVRQFKLRKDNNAIQLSAAEATGKQAQSELEQAESKYMQLSEAFNNQLAGSSFSDVNDFLSALLSEEKFNDYSTACSQYNEKYTQLLNTQSELMTQLEGKQVPDIQSLKEKVASCESEKQELLKSWAVLDDSVRRLEKVIKSYKKKYAEYITDKEKNDRHLSLASMMRGDKGMSFTRYVLGVMLSLVTAQANHLLTDVHGGQFRLYRKHDGDQRSKQGLELEVESALSSQAVRYSVKNLSGGEKFLISLALSMGLSSTVQQRSGGISIDSMFIDEGFGSLDPRSLREAISILCGIKNSRGTIGIISHVKEIKEIIPSCIEVNKDSTGSRLSL